jgi:polyhydroxybutyrate depolymerase
MVIVHPPAGYSGSSQVPLVLNLHGSGSTALEQEGLTGMDASADTNGFIVAYPQAVIPDGSGFDWNVPGVPLAGDRSVPPGAADDVAFVTQLVGVLEQRYCLNSARVYATGFSGGARMASQLACDSSTTFAAVAPVSGLRSPPACRPARPVPIIAFHRESDPVDPFGGQGQAYWTYSVLQAAQDWGQRQGCSPTATTATANPRSPSPPPAGARRGQRWSCTASSVRATNGRAGLIFQGQSPLSSDPSRTPSPPSGRSSPPTRCPERTGEDIAGGGWAL